MANIAAYCRVSTDKDDQLNSLEAQKRFFEEYTNKASDHLVRIYADEGISGTKMKNRAEFMRLMRDAHHGLFDIVVVKDISRFARNTVDFLQSTRKLKELGVETQFLTANMTSMGNSEFVLTIFGALAQEESANLSKRVKFGKQINAKKGRVPNIVYGYDKIKGDYFSLTINEYEAGIVRRIFTMYINGGCGANKIAQIINSEGIKTKRDCKWSQNAIGRILTNELYTGKVINGKQEVEDFLTSTRKNKDESEWHIMDKPDLRIVNDETFVAAAKLLERRTNAFNISHERQSNKHLFSTLIRCDCCGYSFRRIEKVYKNTYIKWVCSGRNANGIDSCNNLTKIDEKELETSIKAYFADMLRDKNNVVKNIVEQFNRIYKAKGDNADYEQELRAQFAKATKSRKRYMDMYEDELITREELREKVSTLNNEIERLESELKLITYNLNKGDQLEQILGNTFKDIDSIIGVECLTNAQLKRVIEKITVNESGEVDVYLRLFADLGLEKSVLVSDNQTQGRH